MCPKGPFQSIGEGKFFTPGALRQAATVQVGDVPPTWPPPSVVPHHPQLGCDSSVVQDTILALNPGQDAFEDNKPESKLKGDMTIQHVITQTLNSIAAKEITKNKYHAPHPRAIPALYGPEQRVPFLHPPPKKLPRITPFGLPKVGMWG